MPTTGSAAAYPGKIVVPSKASAATATAASPPQESTRLDRRLEQDQPVAQAGGERADAELPGAGEGREVRRDRVGRAVGHRVGEREADDDHERAHAEVADPRAEAALADAAPGPPRGVQAEEQDQQRPDDVELLLDRERPVVLERRGRGVVLEVVGAVARELEVGREERRPERVLDRAGRLDRAQEVDRRRHRRDDHQRRRGQDPAGPAGVEAEQRDPAVALGLGDQQTGDQEARDHEEDVHADEAAVERPDLGVVQDHEQDGQGPEPLDVLSEARLHGRHRRSGTPASPLRRAALSRAGWAGVMCFADRGFVFLSMPKAGSTVLQKHFARHAMILFRQPPGMKHMSAVTFEATMAPWLERYGHPRSSYETMCLVRHPLDRAVSWWRYRSRPGAGHSTEGMTLRRVRRRPGLRRDPARYVVQLRHRRRGPGDRRPALPLRAPRRGHPLDVRRSWASPRPSSSRPTSPPPARARWTPPPAPGWRRTSPVTWRSTSSRSEPPAGRGGRAATVSRAAARTARSSRSRSNRRNHARRAQPRPSPRCGGSRHAHRTGRRSSGRSDQSQFSSVASSRARSPRRAAWSV